MGNRNPTKRELSLQLNFTAGKQRRLRRILALVVILGITLVHHQQQSINDYERDFTALHIKTGQLYIATLRQKIEYMSILAENGIIDVSELNEAQNVLNQAVDTERTKAVEMRRRYVD